MSRALRALMENLIDYAGLFPPAALGMREAVGEYAACRRLDEAWMLGRFIAPAEALPDLAREAEGALEPADRWSLSVLVGARDAADAALARAAAQGDFVADLEDRFAGRVRVDVLEAPVPPGAAGPGCGEFVDRLLGELADAGLSGREIFLETPAGGDDAEVLRAVAAAGRTHGGPDGAFPRVGAKLRCGGLVPAAFPSVERVAAVLAMAVELELPLKFTAGLHHPVRHRAAAPDVMMHGFLNVFGAGVLAAEAGLAGERLEACLAETEAAAFSCADDAFAWRDVAVDAAAVGRARARLLPGFGSCSFLEPRDDLAGLGLL